MERALNERKPTWRTQADELRQHIDAYSGFVMANLLWALLSLPIVTMPLATAGLMAYMSLRVRGKEASLFETFVGAIRTRWRPALVVGLIDALVGGVIALNVTAFTRMESLNPLVVPSGAVTLFVLLALLSFNIYAWSLIGLDDFRPRRVLTMSLRFSFAYPLRTFATLLGIGAVVLLSTLLPRAILVLATASAVAYVAAWGSWRVIRLHLNEDERREYLPAAELDG